MKTVRSICTMLAIFLVAACMITFLLGCEQDKPSESEKTETPSVPSEGTQTPSVPSEGTQTPSAPDDERTFLVTFCVQDEVVGTCSYTASNRSINEPAVPEREGYVGKWQDYELDCYDRTVSAYYTPVEYTISFVAGGDTVSEGCYTVENYTGFIVPEVPERAGYIGVWESYELTIGDKTVNAVYTLKDYTVTFKADGKVVQSVGYSVENMSIKAPEVPAKAGYLGAWESYTLDTGDKIVNAVYTPADYTVTFKVDGKVIDTQKYSVENTELTPPAIPERSGYSAKWEDYTFNFTDVTVNAVYAPIEYIVRFTADSVTVDRQRYSVENKSITPPAVPEKAGYTGVWESYTLTTGNLTVKAIYTPNVYTLYIENKELGKIGEKQITYDQLIGKLEFYTPAYAKAVATTIDGVEIDEDTRWDYTKNKTMMVSFKYEDISAYDLNKYMYPFWKDGTGQISFAESVFVRQNASGKVEPLKLLYPAIDVISVRSADLKTLYEEGRDYRLTDDGKIEVIPGGRIPVLSYNEYYYASYNDATAAGRKVIAEAYGNGAFIHAEVNNGSGGMMKWTVAVTYRHSSSSIISKPVAKSEKFAPLLQKIKSGQAIKVVSMGDSITDRWSASGTAANRPPYCPAYNVMLCDYIRTAYGVTVNHKNIAVSGSTTNSANTGGLAKIPAAIAEAPDLVIIAFGMNDGGWMAPNTYVSNINKMISDISNACPNVCFVVIGTCLPNPEFAWNVGQAPVMKYHPVYREYLLDAEKNWNNAAFADVTKAHQEMLQAKVFQDTTGSNSNHPNDYVHRLYAQVAAQTIFGEIFGIK